MKFLATYLMRGRMQAILVASVFALLSLKIPLISVVSSGSVALVTLRRGAAEGWYILICACLASALLGIFLVNSFWFPLLYGLLLWSPVWLIAIVLREGRYLFLAIEIVILIASVAIIGFYLYQPNVAQFWENLLDPVLKLILAQSAANVSDTDLKHFLSTVYHFVMTGLFAQTYAFGLLAGLFLGRGWQAILYNPGGFKKEYLALQGQPLLGVATVMIIASALLFSGLIAEICSNIGILLFVLYGFLGTIVLHCIFAMMKMSRFLVPFLYVTMLFIPQALIPVALVGLADTWLNLRNKIQIKTSS